MGLFDYIEVAEELLPNPEPLKDGFQTKDTPEQYMGHYEIRSDGTLWQQEYDEEDHSNPEAEGLARVAGMLTRVNKRWERTKYTGGICFYTEAVSGNWKEYIALFVDGKMTHIQEEQNNG